MPLVPLKDGYETIEEMEAGLKLPQGSLTSTMARYNEHAARGEDPDFHKHPDWLAPQNRGPWGVYDLTLGTALAAVSSRSAAWPPRSTARYGGTTEPSSKGSTPPGPARPTSPRTAPLLLGNPARRGLILRPQIRPRRRPPSPLNPLPAADVDDVVERPPVGRLIGRSGRSAGRPSAIITAANRSSGMPRSSRARSWSETLACPLPMPRSAAASIIAIVAWPRSKRIRSRCPASCWSCATRTIVAADPRRARPLPHLRELLEPFPLGDDHEVPGLPVARGRCPSARFEDPVEVLTR